MGRILNPNCFSGNVAPLPTWKLIASSFFIQTLSPVSWLKAYLVCSTGQVKATHHDPQSRSSLLSSSQPWHPCWLPSSTGPGPQLHLTTGQTPGTLVGPCFHWLIIEFYCPGGMVFGRRKGAREPEAMNFCPAGAS